MCNCGMCNKCAAGKKIILGVLVLANAVWGLLDWGIFIGLLLILGGIIKVAMPSCGHTDMPQKAGKKK